jgi:hypothetical protein
VRWWLKGKTTRQSHGFLEPPFALVEGKKKKPWNRPVRWWLKVKTTRQSHGFLEPPCALVVEGKNNAPKPRLPGTALCVGGGKKPAVSA